MQIFWIVNDKRISAGMSRKKISKLLYNRTTKRRMGDSAEKKSIVWRKKDKRLCFDLFRMMSIVWMDLVCVTKIKTKAKLIIEEWSFFNAYTLSVCLSELSAKPRANFIIRDIVQFIQRCNYTTNFLNFQQFLSLYNIFLGLRFIVFHI